MGAPVNGHPCAECAEGERRRQLIAGGVLLVLVAGAAFAGYTYGRRTVA